MHTPPSERLLDLAEQAAHRACPDEPYPLPLEALDYVFPHPDLRQRWHDLVEDTETVLAIVSEDHACDPTTCGWTRRFHLDLAAGHRDDDLRRLMSPDCAWVLCGQTATTKARGADACNLHARQLEIRAVA